MEKKQTSMYVEREPLEELQDHIREVWGDQKFSHFMNALIKSHLDNEVRGHSSAKYGDKPETIDDLRKLADELHDRADTLENEFYSNEFFGGGE